jgi:hypothetical protein
VPGPAVTGIDDKMSETNDIRAAVIDGQAPA